MRSILLYANHDSGTVDRVEAALTIAAAFNSHIHCLQVTPFNNYVVMDPFGGVYAMSRILEQLRAEEAKNQAEVEGRLRRAGASWTWINETSDPEGAALDRMNLVDIAIVSIGGEADESAHTPAAARLAIRTNTPILGISSEGPRLDVGGNAMVAWNGSPEASRALCNAVPLLALASRVTIVEVTEDHSGFPALEAAQYLGYHDIKAEVREHPKAEDSTSDALRRAAVEIEASYIVMGSYGHSRLHERVFGGVTKDFSRTSPCTLFLSH